MSNFDIQYNFIAIDRFTKVARKVQKEAAKVATSVEKGSRSFSRQSQTLQKTATHIAKASEKISSLGDVSIDTAKKTNKGMSSLVKGLSKGAHSFGVMTESVAKFADTMAFKGYIQFMNVGLPIMLAGKMGMTYADQIEGANLQMSTLFGKQKNYAVLSKEINQQAAHLAKNSRFTTGEVKATSAHIGVMTHNLKLAKDLTPLVLKYAALEQVTPQAAADKLLAAIRTGGAVAGTGMVLPKGVGGEMAEQRYLMLQRKLGGELKGVLAKDADTAGAALHKMMGQLQKVTGTLLIQATPALHTIGKAMTDMITPVVNFMNHHQELTGDIVKGALAAMTFTTAITLFGAALTAIVMPFELLVKTLETLKIVYLAAAAASKIFGKSVIRSAEKSKEASIAEALSGKGKVGLGIGTAIAAAGVGAAIVAGTIAVAHKRRKLALTESQRLGFVRAHGYGGKTGRAAVLAYATEKSLEGGIMGGGEGMGIPGMAGGVTGLTPVQHKIDMQIKVDQEGKVKDVHAHSPSTGVSLGVNMGHAHG